MRIIEDEHEEAEVGDDEGQRDGKGELLRFLLLIHRRTDGGEERAI